MSAAAVTLRDLWAGYGGAPILEGVSLTVRPLDFVGIIGPNGGGKSTLLKVLLGLLRPMKGTVQIDGKPVESIRHRVGYVPQWIEFDPEFPVRVRDVVRMGRLARTRLFHRYSREDDAVVERVLGQLELLAVADQPMGELSGGQRQRALIARALAVEPLLLLLDEPTANVDTRISATVYDLLARLNEHITILLVTHDMGVVSSQVKSVGCLNRRLHYHGGRDLSREVLEETYECPIDLIAHGVPHRVFPSHAHGSEGCCD